MEKIDHFLLSPNKSSLVFLDLFPCEGKNPEDVVRRYTEKIKVVPDEVRRTCRLTGFTPIPSFTLSPFECESPSLALSGLYHLHGEAGHVLGL